jgi:hypothetical protein
MIDWNWKAIGFLLVLVTVFSAGMAIYLDLEWKNQIKRIRKDDLALREKLKRERQPP